MPQFHHKPEQRPDVVPFFDKDSSTFSYLVIDAVTQHCAIIDPVMDFDYPSGKVSYESADQLIEYIQQHALTLDWIIETHVHADHLSSAPYIREKLGGKVGIGQHVMEVQSIFGDIFNENDDFKRDGSQFDVLFKDGDTYQIGELTVYAFDTPGHTPVCMTHVVGDAAFVGDTLFMPDAGTARADFPKGDARILFQSVQTILALPEETRVFVCHDYGPNGRAIEHVATVHEHKMRNVHVKQGTDIDAYVRMREARDATLGMPRYILPSLQVNMRAGELPPSEKNGQHYFKIPINAFTS